MGQHGFARSTIWKFDSVVMDKEHDVSVRLGKLHIWTQRSTRVSFLIYSNLVLEPTPEIKAVFPNPFHLAYVVTLTAHQLATDLHVTNTGEEPLTFQALLHSYFEADAASCTVGPLKGLTYIDKTNNYAESVETRVRSLIIRVDLTDKVFRLPLGFCAG